MSTDVEKALRDVEHAARIATAKIRETSDPKNEGWYYLSFADEEGFLGGLFIYAHGVATAVDKAWGMGINPGGEVACWGPLAEPRDEYKDRLLSKAEAEEATFQDEKMSEASKEAEALGDDYEACGATNPLIDFGRPCLRFQGHTEYEGQRNHVTATGVWWLE